VSRFVDYLNRAPRLIRFSHDDVFYSFVGVHGLSNVSIDIPLAVAAGTTVNLSCRYDLQSDILYTVKWYKGSEFFRYIPKEMPPIGVFGELGAKVVVSDTLNGTLPFRWRAIDVALSSLIVYQETTRNSPRYRHTFNQRSADIVSKNFPIVSPNRILVEETRFAGNSLRDHRESKSPSVRNRFSSLPIPSPCDDVKFRQVKKPYCLLRKLIAD